jgi:hypothetical protein
MMDDTRHELIAVCGLDCGGCDIRRVPTDPGAARRIVTWFQQMGWLKPGEGVDEIVERGMYCMGCRGSREVHWSPTCWILRCCVDDRRLSFCAECTEFPCRRLRTWADESKRYEQAMARLRRMWLAAQP